MKWNEMFKFVWCNRPAVRLAQSTMLCHQILTAPASNCSTQFGFGALHLVSVSYGEHIHCEPL